MSQRLYRLAGLPITLNESIARVLTLSKNSQFYVRQGDVERLIAQGYLQKLN